MFKEVYFQNELFFTSVVEMASENENILNNLRMFLENKDREIETLKSMIKELKNTQNTVNDNLKINTELKNEFMTQNSENVKCLCNCHKKCMSDNSSQTFETDFQNTDLENLPSDLSNVKDDVTVDTKNEVPTGSISGNDYIYDETSKMYYSPSTGYYYDQERGLLYNPYSRAYYSYDNANNSYVFYYQLDNHTNEATEDITEQVSQKVSGLKLDDVSSAYSYQPPNWPIDYKKKVNKKKKKKNKLVKKEQSESSHLCDKDENTCSSLEEGEIKSSSEEEEEQEYNYDDSSIQSPFIPNDDALLPCIRAIIKQSNSQKVGSLFLIPYTGGTIGSGTNCNICVPDISISRSHANITFDREKWTYNVIDLGSTNGTFINGLKLIHTSDKSSHPLKHGDILSLGSCKMLIHVHSGNVTCQDCEPGVVQAEFSANHEKSSDLNCKDEKQKKRKKNLKLIKKKFGLEDSNYVSGEAAFSSKTVNYEDRAEMRRKTIGSQNPYEKDAPPATLDTVVPSSNKGYKMLKKMGWTEGESIGKNESGILDPIDIHFRNTRAGLGSEVSQQVSVPEDPRLWKWKKAQKRAHELYEGIDDENIDY